MRPSVRIVGETLNILRLYDLVQESLNVKDKHGRVKKEEKKEDQNMIIMMIENSNLSFV